MFFQVFASALSLINCINSNGNILRYKDVSVSRIDGANISETIYKPNPQRNSTTYTIEYDNHGNGYYVPDLTIYKHSLGAYDSTGSKVCDITWCLPIIDSTQFAGFKLETNAYLNGDTFNLQALCTFSAVFNYDPTDPQTIFEYSYLVDFAQATFANSYSYEDNTQYEYMNMVYVLEGLVEFYVNITWVPVNQGYYDSNTNASFDDGYNQGYTDGYVKGAGEGYTQGFNEGASVDSTAIVIFNGILNIALVPINFFLAIFNFEILGINMSALVTSILSICLIIIVVRFVTGKSQGGK